MLRESDKRIRRTAVYAAVHRGDIRRRNTARYACASIGGVKSDPPQSLDGIKLYFDKSAVVCFTALYLKAPRWKGKERAEMLKTARKFQTGKGAMDDGIHSTGHRPAAADPGRAASLPR